MATDNTEVNQKLRSLGTQAKKQEKSADILGDVSKIKISDTETRQKIARLFVIFYFILLTIIIIGVPMYNLVSYNTTHDSRILQYSLQDVIQTYAAVVGPTVGFVIAYYFKSRDDR